MDVTYAVVNKARRGGGAAGRDPAPSARDHAPSDRDHAPPSAPSPTPAGSLPPASPLPSDDAYEVVTPPAAPDGPTPLGFNFRIPRPKGPRDPPAGWGRL